MSKTKRKSRSRPAKEPPRPKDQQVIRKLRKDLISAEKLATSGLTLSCIIHEINNPLAVISSQAEYLRLILESDPIDKNQILNSLNSIESLAERIRKIIDSIQNLSRKTKQNSVPVYPLSQVLDSVFILMNGDLKKNEIELLQEHQDVGVAIKCGQIELGQCLLNLFKNAIQAIRHRPEKWIRVSSVVQPEWVILHFTDCGDSLPPTVQKKLFKPFFTTKAVGEGTGLGLNISRQLLKSQGASLDYESKNKNNVSFRIKIPRA